ncbi:hypothetical protein NQ315_014370 [Exocentrus adspersus]|uniref:Macro domain-containing protein n=1 Tax=Exocentrus adspersus TaxID=1586481 RepID=A0AAV8V7N3_9CUCU|nr:hypothetical protein NQ315_014370 [Exocentrus adspersus]
MYIQMLSKKRANRCQLPEQGKPSITSKTCGSVTEKCTAKAAGEKFGHLDKPTVEIGSIRTNSFSQKGVNVSLQVANLSFEVMSQVLQDFNSPCIIQESEQDLFEVDESYSLVHCVSADFQMSAGIAAKFKSLYGQIDFLKSQNQTEGGLTILKSNSRFIYYLVTKLNYYDKPSYQSLWLSLVKLKAHVKEHGITKLAMPKIGCGLDQLNWFSVRSMIVSCFKDVPVEILFCYLPENKPNISNLDPVTFKPTVEEWEKWLRKVHEVCSPLFKKSNEFPPMSNETVSHPIDEPVIEVSLPSANCPSSAANLSPMCITYPLDPRPFLEVKIHSVSVTCLLDSGASHTVIGQSGLVLLKKHNIPFSSNNHSVRITTADGVCQQVLGETTLPFTLEGETRSLCY